MEMNDHFRFVPVSVVIPCYKAGSFLSRAVDSVLSQSLLPREVILIDDASPDGGVTKGLIQKLVSQIPLVRPGINAISIYLHKNGGPGDARNAGWEKATQSWIAFLDADDIWDHQKLALQYQSLRMNPSIDLLAHKSQFVNNSSSIEKRKTQVDSIALRKIDLQSMLVSNLFPARSVMLKKEISLRFPSRKESEDYSLWLKIIAHGYDVRLMDCVLAYTFRSEFSKGGYSGDLWAQEKRELHTFLSFYKDGHISISLFLLVVLWSLLKFMRRVLKNIFHL
jgi:teichuronic acid biosynthesis glycosyltransferase TuaG